MNIHVNRLCVRRRDVATRISKWVLLHDPGILSHGCLYIDSYVRVTWLFICSTWFVHMCDVIHRYLPRLSFICATQRSRCVAHSLFYKALLQKKPTILRRTLICMWMCTHVYWYVVSLLQNIVSFIGLFCKRDLSFFTYLEDMPFRYPVT